MTALPPPTVAQTIRSLGPIASISVQPFDGHYTGELWNVSVNHSAIGQGEALELALVDLANRLATEGGAE